MKRAFLAIAAVLVPALCQIVAAAPKPPAAKAAVAPRAVPAPAAPRADPLVKAKQIFAVYVQLEKAYSPVIADLYADNAVIKYKRVAPNGKATPFTIPASRYKQILRSGMPEARRKGYMSRYSEVTYTPEGGRVRIKATSYSVQKNYYSPLTLLVGPDGKGAWLIYEQTSESHS
jgi:hypothetical protein